jgi:hypothetical protein
MPQSEKSKAYIKEWRARHPEKVLSYGRKYEASGKRNHEATLEKNRRYRARNPEKVAAINAEWRAAHRAESAERSRKWREEVVGLVRKALGSECACCRESELDVLTLDHVANDGGGMNRRHHHHDYMKVKRAFDSGDAEQISAVRTKYQLLCWNCQQSKRNGGVCIHWRGSLPGPSMKARAVYMRSAQRRAVELLGSQCVGCWENEPEFLALDHINNDGHREKKNKSGSRNANDYYFSVLREFKSGDESRIAAVKARFQVLCHNCNALKHYRGVLVVRRGDPASHPEFPYRSVSATRCG